MHNKKTSKSRLFFNISLVSLIASAIITASVMTGCSSDNKDTKETEVVHGTEIATYEVNGVVVDKDGNILDSEGNKTGETVASVPTGDSNGSDSKSSNSKSDVKSSSKGKTAQASLNDGSSKTQNSSNSQSKQAQNSTASNKTKSNNNSGSASKSTASSKASGPSKASTPYNPDKSKDSTNVLKLGNKRFNVGDTVICTYNLQNASEKLLNFQGNIKYDGTYLKVVSAKLEGSAASGGLLNYNLNQEIRFNGSNLNGYNYTKNKAFITVEYKVLKTGNTTPKINWEVITGLSEKKYCDDNGNLINGIAVTPTYAKK